MIKIGIIGDIGSGKTFVSKQFGYPVFNADKEVSKIYKKNKKCFIQLKKKLPNYINSFPIKKKELTNAIFANKKNLKKIENIVHPKVRKNMKKFIDKNKESKILIFDIPLLLESKKYKEYVLVFVQANKKDIYKNLKKRINFNNKIFKNLKKSQLPVEIKKKKSNYIIKNNFNRFSVKKSVKVLKKKILKNERSNTRH
tara:strand:- start:8660 stop:9253 length:594 start_codon:yes stop_codon:yes gene_type:complete